jgi:hypothetical protein
MVTKLKQTNIVATNKKALVGTKSKIAILILAPLMLALETHSVEAPRRDPADFIDRRIEDLYDGMATKQLDSPWLKSRIPEQREAVERARKERLEAQYRERRLPFDF